MRLVAGRAAEAMHPVEVCPTEAAGGAFAPANGGGDGQLEPERKGGQDGV